MRAVNQETRIAAVRVFDPPKSNLAKSRPAAMIYLARFAPALQKPRREVLSMVCEP